MPAFQAAFQDAALLIPRDADVRDDLRALKLIKGVARIPENYKGKGADGKPRHADTAIALALAYAASQQPAEVYESYSIPRRPAAANDPRRSLRDTITGLFHRRGQL